MASNIPLQSAVPIPPPKRSKRELKYPFASMGVDENNTFFVPGVRSSTMHTAIRRYKASDEGKDKQFTLRAVREVIPGQEEAGEQDGVRIWRTK